MNSRRFAVIADIHGNFRAFQAVLADLSGQRVAGIISLGDNVGYGPEPQEVAEELMARRVVSVLGNHELALNDPVYYRRLNQVSQESLDLTRSLLSPASLAYLTGLDAVAVRHRARFVHGCPPDSVTDYLFNPSKKRLADLFASFPESLCFVGHTHTIDLFSQNGNAAVTSGPVKPGPVQLHRSRRYLIIPGSVGQPRDHIDRKAKYGILDLDEGSFEFRSVAYDVDTTVRLLRERGFPITNALRLQ